MIVKLLTEHHFEFLSLKGGYRGSAESTRVNMSICWKSHALAHLKVPGTIWHDQIYSTTKETHQSFIGAIMENRIKKWKYIYTIFLNNQLCINSLKNVTVLLKSVHAVRQCTEKGAFAKMTSFSLENEYLFLVQFSSLELNSSKNGHDSLLQQ